MPPRDPASSWTAPVSVTTCWAGGAGGSSSFGGGGGSGGTSTVFVYGPGGGGGGEYAAEPAFTCPGISVAGAAEGMRQLTAGMTAAGVPAAAWPPRLPPPSRYARARAAWEETGDLGTLLDLLTVISAAASEEDLR